MTPGPVLPRCLPRQFGGAQHQETDPNPPLVTKVLPRSAPASSLQQLCKQHETKKKTKKNIQTPMPESVSKKELKLYFKMTVSPESGLSTAIQSHLPAAILAPLLFRQG